MGSDNLLWPAWWNPGQQLSRDWKKHPIVVGKLPYPPITSLTFLWVPCSLWDLLRPHPLTHQVPAQSCLCNLLPSKWVPKPRHTSKGAQGEREDTHCLASEINQKGWTQASPGSGLPSGNSGLSAAAVVRVVQQIHLLNDNSFIGKPIQLKPLHPTKSPAALSA